MNVTQNNMLAFNANKEKQMTLKFGKYNYKELSRKV